jgi:cystathionine beta-lyase
MAKKHSLSDKKIGAATQIVHAGRNTKEQGWMVNPPIYQSSTIAFPTLKDFLYAERGYSNNDLVEPYELRYGRYGTQSNFSIEKAIAEIEGGYNSFVTSSGASAVNTALIAFLKSDDHILIPDAVYGPTRAFADKFLAKLNIKTTYYDPKIGVEIKKLINKKTKVILMESPGSLTYEIPDIDQICKIAKENDIITIFDNSWASGIYFKPLSHGIDISVMSLTKYINGHSDVMMGAITTNEQHFLTIYEAFRYMAPNAAPMNCYLVQRGLRTAKLRMDHQYKSALEIAKWLESHPMVAKVLYPALESSESHALWKKYFTGAASILSIVMDKKYSNAALAMMLDNMHFYALGYSWGGYESLIIPSEPHKSRTATKWPHQNRSCFRINIGLEDVEDLKADLEAGFKRLKSK